MEELIYKKLYTAVTDGLEVKPIKKRTCRDVEEEDIVPSGIVTRVRHRSRASLIANVNILVKRRTKKVLQGPPAVRGQRF